MGKCIPADDPKNLWGTLCPSSIPAYLFAILFAATTIAHITQGILYKKWYTIVIVMSGVWQTAAFIFRILSINDQTNSMFYQIWFILILVAPLWINAFVYMVMGRMVYNFLPKGKTYGIPAHRFGLIFVCLDIFSFFVQIGGASMASGNHVPRHQVLLGIHIYMGGIGLQQLFIFAFLALAIRFQQGIRAAVAMRDLTKATHLLYAIYAVLLFITIRIIFRLIEYSSGMDSKIPSQEAYMFVLDSTPMFLALLIMNLVHPGRVMPGKESDLPSRKQRKSEKRYNKVMSVGDGTSLMANEDSTYPVSMGPVDAQDGYGHGVSRSPSPFESARVPQHGVVRAASPYDPQRVPQYEAAPNTSYMNVHT